MVKAAVNNHTSFQVDDLVAMLGDDGRWSTVYRVMGEDEPGRILARRIDDGHPYSIRADLLVPLRMVSNGIPPIDTEEPITTGQRRFLFSLGKYLALDVDDLRAMTPMGSISKMTAAEASNLIDRLCAHSGRPAHRRGQGTATAKQLGLIEHLVERVGFNRNQLGEWLSRQFDVESIAEITDRQLASRIIGGLMAMARNVAEGRVSKRRRRSS